MTASTSARGRRRAAYLLWGCVFAGMLAARLPAVLVAKLIDQACAERCRLGNVGGTLWQGHGTFFSQAADESTASLLHLAWTIDPSTLFAARLTWRLDLPESKSGTISFGAAYWQLNLSGLRFPGGSIEPMLEGRVALRGWGGRFALDNLSLTCAWQNGPCQGEGNGQWLSAQIRSISPLILGDYRFNFQRQGEVSPWTYTLSTETGPLWADLRGNVDGKLLSLTGSAKLDPAIRPSLAPLLAALGPYDSASGRYDLRFSLPVGGR